MKFENKSTAHAVCGSTGGKVEQVCKGLISADIVPETGRLVKGGGLGCAQERQKLILLLYRQLDAEQKAAFLKMVAAMAEGGPSRRRCRI